MKVEKTFPATFEFLAFIDVLHKQGLLKSIYNPYSKTIYLSNYNITKITPISTPGRRIYRSPDQLKIYKQGIGLIIVRTSHGFMTSQDAIFKNIGGELLCLIS
jgi:small subunit ribosomal protein S8